MNAKAFLLTLFLSVAAVSLWAQEKYEYAIVHFIPNNREIQIFTNSSDFTKIQVSKDKIRSYSDASAALDEINKMASEGWELFNTEFSAMSEPYQVFVFYLKKKKN